MVKNIKGKEFNFKYFSVRTHLTISVFDSDPAAVVISPVSRSSSAYMSHTLIKTLLNFIYKRRVKSGLHIFRAAVGAISSPIRSLDLY